MPESQPVLTDDYCIAVFRTRLPKDDLQFTRNELLLNIQLCKKHEVYRSLLIRAGHSCHAATIYQMPNEDATVQFRLRHSGEGNLLAFFDAEVDSFIEDNCMPYFIYTKAFDNLYIPHLMATQNASKKPHITTFAEASSLLGTQRGQLKSKIDDIAATTAARIRS